MNKDKLMFQTSFQMIMTLGSEEKRLKITRDVPFVFNGPFQGCAFNIITSENKSRDYHKMFFCIVLYRKIEISKHRMYDIETGTTKAWWKYNALLTINCLQILK